MPDRSLLWLGLGLGLVLLIGAAWLANKATGGEGAAGLGKKAAGAAGDFAGGVIVGLGEIAGVPPTNQTECDKALAEGRYWDASFACPAKDFLSGGFGGTPKAMPSSPALDQPGGASGSW